MLKQSMVFCVPVSEPATSLNANQLDPTSTGLERPANSPMGASPGADSGVNPQNRLVPGAATGWVVSTPAVLPGVSTAYTNRWPVDWLISSPGATDVTNWWIPSLTVLLCAGQQKEASIWLWHVTSRSDLWWLTLKTWVLLSATAHPSLLVVAGYWDGNGPGTTVSAWYVTLPAAAATAGDPHAAVETSTAADTATSRARMDRRSAMDWCRLMSSSCSGAGARCRCLRQAIRSSTSGRERRRSPFRFPSACPPTGEAPIVGGPSRL